MDKSNRQFIHEFIAGNVGGILGITAVYPLDTVKTRLQCSTKYKSISHVIRSMIKQDGFRALYRGLSAPTLGFGLTFAISFSGYGQGCKLIADYKEKDINKLSLGELSLAGAYTGLIQSPARQIVERLKSVMQIRESSGGKKAYSGIGACALDLIKREGFRNGLFQGFSSVLMREIPQFAVYYPSYELFKKAYSEVFTNDMVSQFLAGGSAGVVQWLPPIYSLDVIKSRMQAYPQGYYKSWVDCAVKVYKEEGIQIFYRGLTPAILRAFPLHAIIFLSYETVIAFMQK